MIPTINSTVKVGMKRRSATVKVKYGGTKKKSKNATAIIDANIPPFLPAIKPLNTMGIMNIMGIFIASKNGLKKKQTMEVTTILKKLTVIGLQ